MAHRPASTGLRPRSGTADQADDGPAAPAMGPDAPWSAGPGEDAARLLAAVRHAPASNLGDTRHRTGLGRNAFDAALTELVEAGLVHRMASSDGTLLMPHRPGIEECLDQIKALWNPHVRRLHDFLGTHELCPRKQVVDRAVHVWGWGEEITRWRLRVLERADLAQAVMDPRDHRRITYRCLPAHPRVREFIHKSDR